MAITDVAYDRHGLEVLTLAESLALLRSRPLGRLAYLEAGAPAIIPVNYLVDGSTIVIRALEGGKVDTAVLGAPVAFEVDDHDPARGAGWSVVVHGRALLIDEPERVARYAAELDSWAVTDDSRTTWIRILADQITGRRLRRR